MAWLAMRWGSVIDDTALPKKGHHSVGVAPQYASSLGKYCQLSVAGLGNVSVARGAGDGGPAVIPAREAGQMILSAWRGPVCRRIDRLL